MGKFFDRMVNGDPNKKNFTRRDLPKNRLELFADVVKTRLLGLMTVNLLYVMFLVPIIIIFLWTYFGVEQRIAAIGAGMSVKTLWEQEVIPYFMSAYLLCIPFYTLAGPAKAGLHYVVRTWSWGEHAAAGADFWEEFKRSWKPAMLYNFLTAVAVYAVAFWVMLLWGSNGITELLRSIGVIVIGILALIFLLMSVYVYPLMVTYKLKFKQLLKNSMIFGLMQMISTFVVLICIALVFLLFALTWQIATVLMLTFGFAFICLGKTIYCGSIFDKYHQYLTNDPYQMRRGMAPYQTEDASESEEAQEPAEEK